MADPLIPDDTPNEELKLDETIDLILVREDDDADSEVEDSQLEDMVLVLDEADINPDKTILFAEPQLAVTVEFDPAEQLSKVIRQIENLKVQAMSRRKDSSSNLGDAKKEIVFEGLGLDVLQVAQVTELMENATDARSLEMVARFLRDTRIVSFQRAQLWGGVDAASSREERPLTKQELANLSEIFLSVLTKGSFEADAIILLLQDRMRLRADFTAWIKGDMDAFHPVKEKRPVVNRLISARQAIDEALQIVPHLNQSIYNESVLDAVPMDSHPEEGGDTMFLFRMGNYAMGHYASKEEITERYRQLGLRPVDLWELIRYNVENPEALDPFPNATYFLIDGEWWFVAFYVNRGVRYITVKQPTNPEGFSPGWHFVGVPLKV